MVRFIGICILFWSISVFSQEETTITDTQNESLLKIIPSLEKNFGIKFSYIDDTIKNSFVSLQFDEKSVITDIIDQLQQQTGLKFEIITSDVITIRDYSEKDTISLCGYILDENDTPLQNIGIFFKEKRTNSITDEKGYFENLEVPYNSPVLISAPGFRQKILTASSFLAKKECTKIYLVHTIETLDEILIEEYLTKGVTKDKEIININIKEIEILPGLIEPDILQSIQLTPGVNSPFETASGLYVRGSTPSQNLVLWNGIKTYHQGHFFGMLSAFNPYVTKEVNFSKSGVSARYGDRIAGIIDITTENEVAKNFSGGAGFNMIHADAVLHTPIIKDRLSLQVSGRRSFTDVLETFTYKQFSDRVFQNTSIAQTTTFNEASNDFYYADYNANIIAQLSDNDKIEINSLYSKNELDFRRNNQTMGLSDHLTTENEGYNIKYSHNADTRFTYHTNAYYTKYLLNYEFNTEESGVITETESKKNSVRDFGAEIDIQYKVSNYHSLSGGYQFSNNSIRYAFVTETPIYELILDQDNRLLNTHSFYGEYVYEKPKNFYLSVGLRYTNYIELRKSFIEPRVFIQQNISKYWAISATGEYRSQAVSKIKESIVSDLSLENQLWTLADENQFPIITSYQCTVGSSFKKKKWYFDVDTYYKQIQNITSLTAGFINPVDNTYHNGESTVYGIDFFLKKHFQRYKTWVSYSYINTENKFDEINDNQSFPGNWNIEHTVKWSHFYTVRNLQLSLGWLWHTGKAFTNVLGVDESGDLVVLDYGAINGNNLPVYHRLDFSASYDFKINKNPTIKYRIGMSVLNLYDKQNVLNRETKTTNSLNNRLINADIVALGITPNLSFRIFW